MKFSEIIDQASALLQTLPATPEHNQHELALHVALGVPLMATKGYAAPEVENVYVRARKLCGQVGDSAELFPTLYGLCMVYLTRAEFKTGHELGEQLLRLAQSRQDSALLVVVVAHYMMGMTLYNIGAPVPARTHLEQASALYDAQQHHSLAFRYGFDPGVACLCETTIALWYLGYPEQALKSSHEALTLAHELSHPSSLVYALNYAATLHQMRREGHAVQDRAEAAIVLSTEQGFSLWLAIGAMLRGWALAAQGDEAEGLSQLREGLVTYRATGTETWRPQYLALLTEAYGKDEQVEEGLSTVAEALAFIERTEERFYEAELYRLQGELTLEKFKVQGSEFNGEEEAEACFHKAIEVAQKQQAKSWELRTSTSLARLWQQQGKPTEARDLLGPIYNWFTGGFDTKDLQDAKALREQLT